MCKTAKVTPLMSETEGNTGDRDELDLIDASSTLAKMRQTKDWYKSVPLEAAVLTMLMPVPVFMYNITSIRPLSLT